MNNSLQVFDFNGSAVMTLDINGEVWFVANDVCEILDLIHEGTRKLDADEAMNIKINSPNGKQNVLVISESGLYALVFRSNNSDAKAFSRWIRREVLPKIRNSKNTEKFTRSIMSAARMIFIAAGLKDNSLALALDRIAVHYTGKSMLALSGIVLENPEMKTENEHE